jgi:ketosteroid isomerase-like protein
MPWTKRTVMTARTVAFIVGVAGLLPVCPAAAEAAKSPTLEAASQALDEALRRDDVEALFARMTDDVVLMPPGEAPLRGKAAARAWYTGLLAQYRTSTLVFTQREVFEDQTTGVVLGAHEWVLRPTAGGEPVVDRGSYMQLWRKQPDGRWLFAREIWNASSPTAAP